MLEPALGSKCNNLFICSFAFLFGHIRNILLTELGRSVWENLDLGRLTSQHSVCTGDLGQDSPIQTSHSVNKNLKKSHILPVPFIYFLICTTLLNILEMTRGKNILPSSLLQNLSPGVFIKVSLVFYSLGPEVNQL